jgi:Zn-dependent protease
MAELSTAVPPSGEAKPAPRGGPPPRSPVVDAVVAILCTAGLLAWLAMSWGWAVAVAGLIGVLVHECGHLLAINALGCGPGRIHIVPFLGGAATMKRPPRTEFQGVLIAVAGPVAGLLTAIPFIAAGVATHDRRWADGGFFIVLLNLLNLVPAPPLDGAKVLGPALARIHPAVERVVLVMIGAVAAFYCWRHNNLLIGVFIAIATLGTLKRKPRPDAQPLSLAEWGGAVALWLGVLALGIVMLGFSLYSSGVIGFDGGSMRLLD